MSTYMFNEAKDGHY